MSISVHATKSDSFHSGFCLAGLSLLLLYAGVAAHFEFGMSARYYLDYIAPSEFMFWVAHVTLAVPGALLLAYGVAPRLAPSSRDLFLKIEAFSSRRPGVAVCAYFAGLLVIAIIGRSVVLLDLPITDDENSVLFGGRIVAAGLLSVPMLQPASAFELLFMFNRDGQVTSMDFPGVVFFAAASVASGLGSWLYAGLAALTGVAVVYAARQLGGTRTALVAALVWLSSPMVLLLSMTTHAHLVSRASVAFALAVYARLFTAQAPRPSAPAGALLGFVAGIGFLCRPFEVGLILIPVALHLVWSAWQLPRLWRPTVVAAVVGCLIPLALFAWYNSATTGVWYLPARFVPGVIDAASHHMRTPLERVGTHLGLNTILLTVFFLGPLGTAAVVPGITGGGVVARVLFYGMAAVLALALAHDNVGVHTVGPIHYSECAVPLTLLAAGGVARLFERLPSSQLSKSTAALVLLGYLLVAVGLFNYTHARSLRWQADNQRLPLAAVEQAGLGRAIVLAPHPPFLHWMRPELARWGSWVLRFPPPDPFFRDDVIFVRADANIAELRRHFPDRRLYRMRYEFDGEPVVLSPVDEHELDATTHGQMNSLTP